MQAWGGWKRTLIVLIITPILLFAIVWTAANYRQDIMNLGSVTASLLAITGWQMRVRLRLKGTIQHEIAVENAAYIANVGWILMETAEKKLVPKLKSPILFRQSQPLVKHRDNTARLLDSWLKSSLRRSDIWHPILYSLGVGAAAIVLTPMILSIIVWLVLPMLVLGWLHRQWLQWLSEPFIALFHWSDESLKEASLRAKMWGAVPFAMIWGIILGVKMGLAYGAYGWLAIAMFPLAGFYWFKLLNEVMTSISSIRGKKVEKRNNHAI